MACKPTSVLTDRVPISNDHRTIRYNDDITVTWIGRLDSAKLRLLQVILNDLCNLRKEGWRVRLKVIGDGNARELHKLLKALNLKESTDLLGEVKYEDLRVNLIGSD